MSKKTTTNNAPKSAAMALLLGLSALLGSAAQAQACYRAQDTEGTFAALDPGAPGAADADIAAATAKLLGGGSAQRTRSRCLQRALSRNADFQVGSVLLGIKLGAEGKPQQVSLLRSDYNDGMLHACLAEMVCGWQWPATGREHLLSQSFDFGTPTNEPEKMKDFRDGRKL